MTETGDREEARPRDPRAALERLLAGNARFVADRKLNQGHDSGRRAELAAGQRPWAVVLGCADSRVPPELIFDRGLGELFVVRVAGNTAAEPLVVGSVEFALAQLDSMLVVVLGHEGCGAVEAAVEAATDGASATGSIGDVLAPIVPVVEEVAAAEPGLSPVDLAGRSVRANVAAAVTELTERSPLISDLAESGEVQVVGAEYRLETGEIVVL